MASDKIPQLTVEFYQQRIREAQARGERDPVRAAGGYAAGEEERGREILAKHVRPGMRVLDIGCGCGVLRELFPEKILYIGADMVPEFIAEAKERYKSYPGTKFLVFDLTSLLLPNNCTVDPLTTFDVVVGREVLAPLAALGQDKLTAIISLLLSLGSKVIFFSRNHVAADVWERGPGGKAVQTGWAKEME